MIAKTDAMVLKSMRYRDTSRIVTFYTRRYGKIKAIAKGARDIKSKFGAALEPMTLSSLVLYKKEYRDLQLVSQCDIVRRYKRIHSEMDRMSVALSVLELVNQVTHDEEENLPLFSLLVEMFNNLEHAVQRYESLFYAFEVRIAALFGFGLHLEKCISCGRTLEFESVAPSFVFDVGKGGMYCATCPVVGAFKSPIGHSNHRIQPQTAVVLRELLRENLENITNLQYRTATGNELNETLRLYLQYHIEGLKPSRSALVLKKLHV